MTAIIEHRKDIEMADWIEWNGGEMPVPEGTKIEVKHRDGELYTTEAGGFWSRFWTQSSECYDIVAYRVLEPILTPEEQAELDKAVETLIEEKKAEILARRNVKKGRIWSADDIEVGEEYYSVWGNGNVGRLTWDGCEYDCERVLIGEAFWDEQSALENREKQKAKAKWERLAHEAWEAYGENRNGWSYYLLEGGSPLFTAEKIEGVTLFPNTTSIMQAKEEMGEDIKWLFV